MTEHPAKPADAAWRFTRAHVALIVLVLAWCGTVMSIAPRHAGAMADDGEYYLAALALAQGKGYVLLSRPDNPTPKYPPGLSLTAAPLIYFFPSYGAARVLIGLFGILLILAGFRLLTDWGIEGVESVLLLIPVMFQPHMLTLATVFMSDIPFAAVVLAFFCLKGTTRKHALLLGVLAAYAVLLRSNGWSLLLAGVWIAKGRTGYLLMGFLVVWFPVRSVFAGSGSETYADNLAFFAQSAWGEIVRLVGGQAWSYLQSVGLWVYPVIETNRFRSVGLLFVVAALIPFGLGLRYFKSRPFLVHTLSSLGLLIFWPWSLGMRGTLWIGPMVLFCWYRGWGRFRGVALAVTLICLIPMTVQVIRRSRQNAEAPLDGALASISATTAPDAVVVSALPETVYLYTGRQGCRSFLDGDRITNRLGNWEAIIRCAGDRQVYLLLTRDDDQQAQSAALLRNSPKPTVLTFENERLRIYRVN